MSGSSPRAQRAQVVSFDAGGTLLEVAEPVGETYARLARDAGFDVTADAMAEGFRRAFAVAPPLAAPPSRRGDLLEYERGWWRSVVFSSLAHAVRDRHGTASTDEAARERFFAEAFEHYASPRAWRLFPDVRPVLAELQRRGLTLIVLSNFDRRLDPMLEGFGLRDAFAAVVVSSAAGAAKPAAEIFAHAREPFGDVPANAFLHVGDSLAEDVHGARGAGWQAVWIDRDPTSAERSPPSDVTRIATLEALLELVQSSVG